MARATLAALLLAILVAGCSTPGPDTLKAVYGADFPGKVGAALNGTHLEAQVAGGSWSAEPKVVLPVQQVATAPMAGPAPQGGGGQVTALPPVNATVDVRIAEHDRLGGLVAHWSVVGSSAPATVLAADQVFHASVNTVGPFQVKVELTRSAADNEVLAVYAPLAGHVEGHWVATGQVQPQSPPSSGNPATKRDQMVDRFQVNVGAGANVVAKTSYAGSTPATGGTDVDLGLYGPDGKGVMCSSSGGGTIPVVGGGNPLPDPSASTEALTAPTTVAGTWSIDVGAQANGCPLVGGGTGSFFYVNSGPVPYKLDLTIG